MYASIFTLTIRFEGKNGGRGERKKTGVENIRNNRGYTRAALDRETRDRGKSAWNNRIIKGWSGVLTLFSKLGENTGNTELRRKRDVLHFVPGRVASSTGESLEIVHWFSTYTSIQLSLLRERLEAISGAERIPRDSIEIVGNLKLYPIFNRWKRNKLCHHNILKIIKYTQ